MQTDLDIVAASRALDGRQAETIGAYRRLCGDFEKWCHDRKISSLPASIETIALYILHIAPVYRPNSINNVISAISYLHRLHGFTFDQRFLKPVLKSIGRVHGAATRKKPAIELDYLRVLLERFPMHKRGLRDRAIFMIGFCGALRCEELMRLDYCKFGEDAMGRIRIDRWGATIEMRYAGNAVVRARTVLKYITRQPEFCAVKAVEDWIAEAAISEGPLFRAINKHGHVKETRLLRNNMSVLLRRALKDAEVARGRTPAEAKEIARPYTVQSLRIGFIKTALEAGATPERIAMHLGWTTSQSIDQYKRRYKTVRYNPLLAVMAPPELPCQLDKSSSSPGQVLPSLVRQPIINRDEFMRRYGAEAACHEALVRCLWPDGFRCPRCQQTRHSYFRARRAYRCSRCRLQTTAQACSIFRNSLLPLTKWFLAYYLLRSKTHLTPRELANELNIKWDTAQSMKRILTSAMEKSEGDFQLSGLVQIDVNSGLLSEVPGERGSTPSAT